MDNAEVLTRHVPPLVRAIKWTVPLQTLLSKILLLLVRLTIMFAVLPDIEQADLFSVIFLLVLQNVRRGIVFFT